MPSTASHLTASQWLAENGPKELELLFRAIVFHPSAPILIADRRSPLPGGQCRRQQAPGTAARRNHRPQSG